MSKDVTAKLHDYFRRTYWSREAVHRVVVVYALLCHLARQNIFATLPYLDVRGPSGSGKSTLGRALVWIANGLISGGRTPAAFLRMIDEVPGRLMVLDEGEQVLRGERRALFENILLTGDHIVGGTVDRVRSGTSGEVMRYRTFGPKVIVSIRGIDESALLRRAIPIDSREAPLTFVPASEKKIFIEAETMRDELQKWATKAKGVVQERLVEYRRGTNFASQAHRALWSPMLAVASVVGVDLSAACTAHGVSLRHAAALSLHEVLPELLSDLPPGRYYLTDLLRRHLRERYGGRSDMWSEERIGRTLRQLGWTVSRGNRGRFITVEVSRGAGSVGVPVVSVSSPNDGGASGMLAMDAEPHVPKAGPTPNTRPGPIGTASDRNSQSKAAAHALGSPKETGA